jgi:hypothetical protein
VTKNDIKGEIYMFKVRIFAIVVCLVTLISVFPVQANAAEVELKGYTIGISDGIYLRYHVEMSESRYNAGGYIRFTKSNGEITEINISEGRKDANSGYYVYSCEVAAAEMTERITAVVYKENGSVERSFGRYSVREYAEDILNGSEYTEIAKEAVKAMLNYGAYAQKYFGNTGNGLANEGIEDNVSELESIEDGVVRFSGDLSGLNYVSTALELCSRTAMYHYFTLDAGKSISDYVFKSGGKEITPTVSEKNGVVRYCIKIEGITPNNLNKGSSLSVYGADGVRLVAFTYNPTHYLYLIVTTVKDNDLLVDLAKAMYLYSEAVYIYSVS